ncbi:5'-nucleotidase C-terminal domain-containing protein [Hanstruepera marina]|uniref:5'-nucleotidase C-terminal domain-containing protein n=1 Tax=Hanstruepera marina TaxID=2873265 RepID=UPI001CA704DD|nr:5'-nucleotidase [Hanstruepera marina]
MRFQYVLILLFAMVFSSCKNDSWHVKKIEGKQLNINDKLDTKKEIDEFIKPYREHVNAELDSVLSYSIDTYSKKDGELNTAIGNLFADVIYEQSNPVFKSRTGNEIDMVMVNHGGIRSIISKGNITIRTAYEIMPFENSIVVVGLKGESINELISYLTHAKRAHPISGLRLTVDDEFSVVEATIKGEPIDPNKIYYVATNDYLYNGGDHMTFFQPNESLEILNYKIRNALLDYFIKTDTIRPVIDNRFIQITPQP